jgi:hypothetical protein
VKPCFRLAKDVAVLIPVAGEVEVLSASPSLKAAQDAVGGYVEMLQIERDGVRGQALFNEDGLRLQQDFNERASAIVGRPIVGPVVILTGKRRWR